MKRFFIITITTISLFCFNGCFFNPSEESRDFNEKDGTAGSISMEFNDMGDAINDVPGMSSAEMQTHALADDTVKIKIITPWSYSETCKGWIRSVEVTYPEGSWSRYDTIWFYDAGQNALVKPEPGTVDHYKHVRTINGIKNNNTLEHRFEMNVTIEKGISDTIFTFNGTITGIYNNNRLKTTLITDVKRKLVHTFVRWLSFPYQGTINIDLPLKTIVIQFGGENTATVTVTRKSDGKQWVYLVNISNGKEL